MRIKLPFDGVVISCGNMICMYFHMEFSMPNLKKSKMMERMSVWFVLGRSLRLVLLKIIVLNKMADTYQFLFVF